MEETLPLWVYAVVFATAFGASAGTVPLWIRVAQSWGLVDQPGHRKIHHQPIPLAGGLAIATGILIPLVLALIALRLPFVGEHVIELSTYGLNERRAQLATLILGALGMLAMGAYDDRKALSAGKKFILQLVIALMVAAGGTRITLFIPLEPMSYVLTVLWILTLVNAFNFTDNMNGLCTGLAGLSATFFGIHAALPEHYLVATFGFLIAGAVFGFLPFNYPRAKAFLGDSGSHLAGYLIAVLAILPHFHHAENPSPWAVLSPLLVLGIVLVDLLWVVSYRLCHRRPVYIGDTNHLSHKLTAMGCSTWQAVLILWMGHILIASSSFILFR